MDNLTHSMFGVAIAEATYQIYRKKLNSSDAEALSRKPFYFTSILANNFPDFDLLMNYLDPTALGYLLHHRGHTHTALWGIPQAILIAAIVFLRTGFSLPILILSFLGVATHLLLDFQNSYGVHLWTPVSNHWQYGDTLFIVEPLFWIPTFVMLTFVNRSLWLKAILISIFIGVQVLGLTVGISSLFSVLASIGAALMVWILFSKIKTASHWWATAVALFSIWTIFKINANQAHQTLQDTYQKLQLTGVEDIVLSPLPSQPYCWAFIVIRNQGGMYSTDVGTVMTFSNWMIPSCPKWDRGIGVNLTPVSQNPQPNIVWHGTWTASLEELTRGYSNSCRIRAWFQFARVPVRHENFFGDLRFGWADPSNFSALEVADPRSPPNTDCPPISAPWAPPRAKLLPIL